MFEHHYCERNQTCAFYCHSCAGLERTMSECEYGGPPGGPTAARSSVMTKMLSRAYVEGCVECQDSGVPQTSAIAGPSQAGYVWATAAANCAAACDGMHAVRSYDGGGGKGTHCRHTGRAVIAKNECGSESLRRENCRTTRQEHGGELKTHGSHHGLGLGTQSV